MRQFVFRYRSPEHWLRVFQTYCGPVVRAFAALSPVEQEGLARDLLDLARRGNRAEAAVMAAPSDSSPGGRGEGLTQSGAVLYSAAEL